MDDNVDLKREIAQQRALREEAERIALAAQATAQNERASRIEERARREAEQGRREKAEQRVLNDRRKQEEELRQHRPQSLPAYLQACHSISLAIQVETDPLKVTKGAVTNPLGRLYPRRIIPWHDFDATQEETWNLLAESDFATKPQFPSQHDCEELLQASPISSEVMLRSFEQRAVEDPVKKIVAAVISDTELQVKLGLGKKIVFRDHTNIGQNENSASAPATSASSKKSTSKGKTTVRGIGGTADQFCIYTTADGSSVVKVAIEFKAPHKLTFDLVKDGYTSEIHPDRDVINKKGNDIEFKSRELAAAVVTQLYSYMIPRGIQYGYISTGETYVFLHIPDDPTIVYFYKSVPSVDVRNNDELRLRKTAVARVFAFVLKSLLVEPPPQSWHDAAAELTTWPEEYDSELERTPELRRKVKEPHDPLYEPSPKGKRRHEFTRSPVRTRSSYKKSAIEPEEEEDGNNEADPPSPSPSRPARFDFEIVISDYSRRQTDQS
ncbi:hypothetical protein SEPCBS119000_005980 [Sporothrix epigloea]|uniref:Metalloprotease m41 ftsh n=1 Tax=Sporothrix epigloea TaxID=1892477 RepID=A0ABP0E0I3_9PEZI